MVNKFLSSVGGTIRVTFKVFIAVVVLFFLIPLLLRVIGYQVDVSGGILGRKAAEEHNVDLCNKIVVFWTILGPPSAERRASCVRVYAERTKDPSVCELLLPSQYGWDCLGASEKLDERMCWFDFTPVFKKDSTTPMPECGGRKKEFADRCCSMATMLYVDRGDSCESFADSEILHDQCQELLARREQKVEYCSSIHSDHVRVSCEVAVRALNAQDAL